MINIGYKPKKHFENIVKNNLRTLSVDLGDWEQVREKSVSYDGCKSFDVQKLKHSILKRALKKQDLSSVSIFSLKL